MKVGSLCKRAIVAIECLVTDRDLVIASVARELAPSEVFVGAIATQPLVSIGTASSASEAAALMQSSGVRRLLVVDVHGEVAGLLSSDDLLDALLEPFRMLASALRVNVAREETLRSDAPPTSNRRLFLPLAHLPVRA